MNEIISRLVNRLGISSGAGCYWADEAAYKAVLAALLGENERVVTVTDVPYQGDRWIVLGLIEADRGMPDHPLLIQTRLHLSDEVKAKLQAHGWLGREKQLTSEEVAAFFRGRANGLTDIARDGFPRAWAPAARDSFAKVSIGGDLPMPTQTTNDVEWRSNKYDWYDLNDMPLGGSVWRISATNTLWLFTLHGAHWEVTIVPECAWATTAQYDGNKDFGALLDGALEAMRVLGEIPA